MDGMEACVQIKQYLNESQEEMSDIRLFDSRVSSGLSNIGSRVSSALSNIDYRYDSSVMSNIEIKRRVPFIYALTSLTD